MKKKALQKFRLSAETLRHLDPAVLADTQGAGRMSTLCDNTLADTCPGICTRGCVTQLHTCFC